MNPLVLNLIQALFIAWLTLVLLGTAVWRRYPTRSLFTYSAMSVLGTLSVAGAAGGYLLSQDPDFDVSPLAFAVSVGRGTALVLLVALVWYEHASKYRGMK